MTRFTLADADRASDEWGANCGPGALAAIMDMTLDEIKPVMFAVGFEARRYTNPSMMNAALRMIGRPWRKIGASWPDYGLVRVQWEGPWTQPGAPMAARYRYTHWVGSFQGRSACGVFDINCMNNGTGWCSLDDWSRVIAPFLAANHPRATGGWRVTHGIEVERRGEAR